MIIDTHCHLEMKHFDKDRDSVVQRALENGVKKMITVGTNIKDCQKVIEIANTCPEVFCAVGVHPHDSREIVAHGVKKIRSLLSEKKVLALGEIGLDFFKNYAPRDVQIEAFEKQLALALDLDVPVIIHDRDAHDEILDILKKNKKGLYRGVFHCFSGDMDFAEKVLDLGFYLSFTGTITYKNEVNSHKVLDMVPWDRVMVETDCPYLTPVPFRGKRNEPSYVKYVGEKLAELWGVSFQEAANITTENAFRLFGFEYAGKKPEIAYEWKGNLYLNITNRCTSRCSFCAKQPDYQLGSINLRLNREPTVMEVMAKVKDLEKYPEVVFCGYGEPTKRLDDLLEIAVLLRKKGAEKIRLNTNGHSDLINKKETTHLFKDVIDSVSISLNAHDRLSYLNLCKPEFGEKSFDKVKKFIQDIKKFVPEVTATAVNHPNVDIEKCRLIAKDELGVNFRARG